MSKREKGTPAESWVFEPKPEGETGMQAIERKCRESARYAAQQLAERYLKIQEMAKEIRREG